MSGGGLVRAGWRAWSLCLVLGSGSAIAAEATPVAPEPAARELDVKVGSTFCGSAVDLERETTRRSPSLHFTSGGLGGEVVVEGVPALGKRGVGARILLQIETGSVERELWASTCDELVRAVGFLLSMTYDPPAPEMGEQLPLPSDAAAEPEASAPPVEAEEEPVGEAVPAPAREDGRVTARVEPVPRPLSHPNAPTSDATWRLGLGPTAAWGPVPGPAWGGMGFIELGWGNPATLSGLVRLGLGADFGPSTQFDGGSAQFRRQLGALWVAPRWTFGAVQLAPSAFARGGLIFARGQATEDARSFQRPWLDVGVAGLASLELGQGLLLDLEVTGSRAMTRYAFQFDPVIFYHVPAWLLGSGVYLSVAF